MAGLQSLQHSYPAGGCRPAPRRSWEVRPLLISAARGTAAGCPSTEAIADAQWQFVSQRDAFGPSPTAVDAAGEATAGAGNHSDPSVPPPAGWQPPLCGGGSEVAQLRPPPPPAYSKALPVHCSLTARKVRLPLPPSRHHLSGWPPGGHVCPGASVEASPRLTVDAPCPSTHPQFPKATARAVHRLFATCSNDLQLLGAAACEVTG